jgi:hypothetical protein
MPTESRELLAVGILGGKSRGFESRLGGRIETLLSRSRTFSPGASANSVAASAIVLTAPLLAGSLAQRWFAFAQSAIVSFEVASIKPSPHLLLGEAFVYGMPDAPGRFTGYFIPLKDLMIAMQEQLCLKIESTEGPVEFLVIDHAETPVAN